MVSTTDKSSIENRIGLIQRALSYALSHFVHTQILILLVFGVVHFLPPKAHTHTKRLNYNTANHTNQPRLQNSEGFKWYIPMSKEERRRRTNISQPITSLNPLIREPILILKEHGYEVLEQRIMEDPRRGIDKKIET